MFAGASRALLASIVFAFETTRQPIGLLPLLAGCTGAYLVSLLRMEHSIMTERLARRGAPVRTEYAADYLHQVLVRDCCSSSVVAVEADDAIETVREWMTRGVEGATHQGFPVVDANGYLVGVVTRRDIFDPAADGRQAVRSLVRRPPVIIHDDNTARDAADHMVRERVGRLPVVTRADPRRPIGIISRSDLLEAHERRLHASSRAVRSLVIGPKAWRR